MEDRRMKMHDIAEIVGISVDRMHNILHKELKMKKYTMDRLLTIDQTRIRKDISQQYLSILERNPQDFWHQFVTIDEVNPYTSESKQ